MLIEKYIVMGIKYDELYVKNIQSTFYKYLFNLSKKTVKSLV